jgi:hypothetical protein
MFSAFQLPLLIYMESLIQREFNTNFVVLFLSLIVYYSINRFQTFSCLSKHSFNREGLHAHQINQGPGGGKPPQSSLHLPSDVPAGRGLSGRIEGRVVVRGDPVIAFTDDSEVENAIAQC